jgi:hypothetical protein
MKFKPRLTSTGVNRGLRDFAHFATLSVGDFGVVDGVGDSGDNEPL